MNSPLFSTLHVSRFDLEIWSILSIACETPFEPAGDGCYFYPDNVFVTSWNAAQSICESYGAHLATIKTGEENRAFLEGVLNEQGKSKDNINHCDWYAHSLRNHRSADWRR